jgi:hypothetical protein
MKEGDDFVVFHEPGIAFRATGEVADEHTFGNLAPGDAGNHGTGGEPFVFAFARMHIEIDAAEALAFAAGCGVKDVEGVDRSVPHHGVFHGLERDVEEARSGGEDAGLDLRIREVGADDLRVEVVFRAPVLFLPVVVIGLAYGGDARLLLLREGE